MMRAGQARRGRWALSFADLTLLLLGFFVLIQASGARKDEAMQGIGQQFGAIVTPTHVDIAAAELFDPGEALLAAGASERLASTARALLKEGKLIEIQSFGMDNGQQRFDAWDLSAARLGAVARSLQSAGIPQESIRIAGLVEAPKAASADAAPPIAGQTIRILTRPAQP